MKWFLFLFSPLSFFYFLFDYIITRYEELPVETPFFYSPSSFRAARGQFRGRGKEGQSRCGDIGRAFPPFLSFTALANRAAAEEFLRKEVTARHFLSLPHGPTLHFWWLGREGEAGGRGSSPFPFLLRLSAPGRGCSPAGCGRAFFFFPSLPPLTWTFRCRPKRQLKKSQIPSPLPNFPKELLGVFPPFSFFFLKEKRWE